MSGLHSEGIRKANALIFHPLIPTFSQWEKERPCQTFHGLWDSIEVTSLLSRKHPLPQGEGWGEGIRKANTLIFHPLIPTFSRWEKERPCQTFHGLWDSSEVTSLLSHKRPLPQGEGWGEGIR